MILVVVLAAWLVLGGVLSLALSRMVRERGHRSERPASTVVLALGAGGPGLAPLPR